MHKLALIAVAAALASCATPPAGSTLVDNPANLPTIQKVYADRLAKVKIGMSLDQFRAIFPETYVAGQNGDVTAYELSRDVSYVTQHDIDVQNFWWGVGSPDARTYRQVLWFYFRNSKLARWGRPQDWPPNPDVIIENRNAP